jgi:hypothetical protein
MEAVPDTRYTDNNFSIIDQRGHVRTNATGPSHDCFPEGVSSRERCCCFNFSFACRSECHIPRQLPAVLINSDEVGIRSCHVELAVSQTCASVRRSTTEPFGIKWVFVAPQLFTGACIQCDEMILRRGDVHDAVSNQRSCLKRLTDAGAELPPQC